MEYKEVVGRRRSIRFWQPWHPVEHEKLQRILEAIYRAPRVLDIDFIRVVVMELDKVSTEDMATMKTPTTATQLDLVPVLIWVFADMEAIANVGDNLRQLMDAGALPESHGWTEERLRDTILPEVYDKLSQDPEVMPIGFGEGAKSYPIDLIRLARSAQGIAQTYGILAAVNEGLGVQLSWVTPAAPRKIMDIPPTWLGENPIFVGYPAESWDAGGQRPREPLEEDFFEGRYGRPFRSNPAVVERLKEQKLIQPQQPITQRLAELRRIARTYGLPE